MKSKILFYIGILLISAFMLSCTPKGTFLISLQYIPHQDFSSFREKVGTNIGIASLKDERSDTLYIGQQTKLSGSSNYFISCPFPLEKAIIDALTETLSRHGVQTMSISNWDMTPQSLKNIETDSVLMIEIKKFWTEGRGSLFRTKLKTSIQFIIHLGVKKEGEVFTRKVEVEKEKNIFILKPEKVEQMVNGTLTDIFDSYFSDPYGSSF